MAEETSGKEPNKLMGALSYLGILIIVPLVALKPEEKDNYIKTHLRQGIGILALDVVAWFIRFMGSLIGGGIGSLIFWIGSLILFLAFVLIIIGVIRAIKPSTEKLPIFGDFFDKTFSSLIK